MTRMKKVLILLNLLLDKMGSAAGETRLPRTKNKEVMKNV